MKIAVALFAVAGLAVSAGPALASSASAATPNGALAHGALATGALAAAAPQPGATPGPPLGPTGLSARPGPGSPQAQATTAPAGAPAAAPAGGTALVARYTFDAGAVAGKVADTSGRGPALTVRTADQGEVRFLTSPQGGRYVGFPARCADGAATCPRGLLEAPDDADLNPGTRTFSWSARVYLTKAQLAGSANVLQKGVANTGSQWKMQVGATQGRAQCVVVGTGQSTGYVVKSTVSVADGQWHKVLCQRSGSTLTVFVDGTARGQVAVPATLSITNNLPLRVGGPNFSKKSDMYHGFLDDVYAELG